MLINHRKLVLRDLVPSEIKINAFKNAVMIVRVNSTRIALLALDLFDI